MQDFIFTIKNLPPKKSKENRKMFEEYKNNFFELAKVVNEKKYETISLQTAVEKIKRVSAFLNYAYELERLDKNRLDLKYIMPSNAQKQKAIDQEKSERVGFNDRELSKLFNESNWYKSKLEKNYKQEQDKFYIPLIALFTGMRLNEIAQLYVDDIKKENDIYYFQVDDKYTNQNLKNVSSKRKIPIHTKLVEFGLLDYIEKLKKANEERLFPQLYYTKGKGYGQAFSKKFNNKNFKLQWIDKEKLENKKIKVDFHSFRHTFTNKIIGKVEDSIVDKLLGHVGSSTNQKTYSKNIDINFLKECVEKLDIEKIDFSNIQKFLASMNEK